jgi:mRNA-degrading endonuclease RelE of RelBE toxin-antitoxin system
MADSNDGNYQFLITDGAMEDMNLCAKNDAFAAACIASLLQEVRGNPRYCKNMVDEHFADGHVEDICGVWSLQSQRINAYRVKLIEINKWRLIFVVDHKSQRIALIAVMKRDNNYQKDRPLWARIEREYDAIGFTRY